MRGILKLAYKLLVNDKAKFTALLVGITFAVFLMVAMTSLFAGVLNRASATVINWAPPCGSWILLCKPSRVLSECPITCWTRCAACRVSVMPYRCTPEAPW